MPDLLYVLLTLASFAGLALLVGVLDRRLVAPEDAIASDDAVAEPVPTAASR